MSKPTSQTFEEAMARFKDPYAGNLADLRAAHQRELAEAHVALCGHDHSVCLDHEWRRQMESCGFDSVAKVLDMIAEARAEQARIAYEHFEELGPPNGDDCCDQVFGVFLAYLREEFERRAKGGK